MRFVIAEELRARLESGGALTEVRVVYVSYRSESYSRSEMIKRSLQHYGFYCNWALHVSLTNATARSILGLFDEAHPLLRDKRELPQDLRRRIEGMIHLSRFEDDTIEDALHPVVYDGGESWVFRIRWVCAGKDGTQGAFDSYNSVERDSPE